MSPPPPPLRLVRAAGRPAPSGAGLASTGPEPDDAELARLACAGDPRAAPLVWDRYASMVRGVLRRAVGPGHDVEDLVQEAFLGFFRNVRSLRDAAALRPFLYGIAVRTAQSALRRRRVRRWLRLSDDGEVPEIAPSGQDARAQEAARRLYAILDELPDRERLAFVLRHVEGHELTEAAHALGVSLATLKRTLSRAERHVHSRARADDLLQEWTEGTHD